MRDESKSVYSGNVFGDILALVNNWPKLSPLNKNTKIHSSIYILC